MSKFHSTRRGLALTNCATALTYSAASLAGNMATFATGGYAASNH